MGDWDVDGVANIGPQMWGGREIPKYVGCLCTPPFFEAQMRQTNHVKVHLASATGDCALLQH